MTTNLQFSITLTPVGYENNWPKFYLKIDNNLQDDNILKEEHTYNFDVALEDGHHRIVVGFTNKNDTDTMVVDNKIINDKAIIIKKVVIEGYELDDFLYRSVYRPIGREESRSSFLSWNGEWHLDIITPIFTWIHKTQQLGLIY